MLAEYDGRILGFASGSGAVVKELEFISLFRGLAAFWVLASHCSIWGGYDLPIPSPKAAVDLFMVISGYLMVANAYARRAVEPLDDVRNWKRFWIRRFFRLAPAYYLSLALAVLAAEYFLGGYKHLQEISSGPWQEGGVYDPLRIRYTLENILLHLTFLFGLHPQYSFSSFLPDWSLSLEMQYYLAFPALLLLAYRMGALRSAFLVGIPAFLVGLWVSSGLTFYEPSLLPMRLHCFIAGMLMFGVMEPGLGHRRRLTLQLGAIFFVSLAFAYGESPFALLVLFIAMLQLGWMEKTASRPRWLAATVSNPVTRFASNTSYGAYLFHGFFLSVAGWLFASSETLRALSPLLRVQFLLAFVTAGTYSVAYLVYRYVEVPGIRLGSRVLRSGLLRPVTDASTVAKA